MKNLNLLIVEGNLQKENENFKKSGIETHTESLKDSLAYYRKDLNIDVFNPCSEESFNKVISKIKKYDGLIWGGSSLNIYNDCIEIRRQIAFMKECFKNIKKILGICWGMQVAVTATCIPQHIAKIFLIFLKHSFIKEICLRISIQSL